MKKSNQILWSSIVCLIISAYIGQCTEEVGGSLFWLCGALAIGSMLIGLPMWYITRSREKGQPKKWPYLIAASGAIYVFVCLSAAIAPEELIVTEPTATATVTPTYTPIPTQTPITTPPGYTEITFDELYSDLRKNALVAAEKHSGKYYAIIGELGTIDAQGHYFFLYEPDAFLFGENMDCTITSDAVLQKLKTLARNDDITVYGEITSVGELLGYTLNAHYIIK